MELLGTQARSEFHLVVIRCTRGKPGGKPLEFGQNENYRFGREPCCGMRGDRLQTPFGNVHAL